MPDPPPELSVSLITQIVGSIMGGVVGGFSGFIASRVLEARSNQRMRDNVASALAAEIDALSGEIRDRYLPLLRADMADTQAGREALNRFRGEREYMPIFRSLGVNIGLLPQPLPRDLATWYARGSVLLERSHELHDLFRSTDPNELKHAMRVAEAQAAQAEELIRTAEPLVRRLYDL